MSEFKGTPGPWHAVHNGLYFDIKPNDSPQNLADTQKNEHLGIDAEIEKFNANLIAAAPDLLEALQGVIKVADRDTDEFNKAKAAIAKALIPQEPKIDNSTNR